MNRRSLSAVAAFLLFAAPIARAQTTPPAPASVPASLKVEISNFTFTPAALTIAPGTEVVWINRDVEPHTVVSSADPKLFKSPPLDTGDSFAFVFKDAGSYAYFCSIHPHMQGVITVK